MARGRRHRRIVHIVATIKGLFEMRTVGPRTIDKSPHLMGEIIAFHNRAFGAAANQKDTLADIESGP